MLRAQRAEEERANFEAAMHDLRQRNLYFQQQEDQRLADIDRHRQQRLQEEQAQRTAQSRCDPEVQVCSALLCQVVYLYILYATWCSGVTLLCAQNGLEQHSHLL